MLWPASGQDVFDVGHLPVPEPASMVADHYWWVSWRRATSVPFRPQVLGDPVCHLTVEDANGPLHGYDVPACLVHGVVRQMFTVELPLAGRVAGLAFRPGGLAALLDVDVSGLTGAVVPAADLFGRDIGRVIGRVVAEPEEAARRDLLTDQIGSILEPQSDRVRADEGYRIVLAAVEAMRSREQVRLAGVAERSGTSPRTLQRLFARYVGASPSWVLRRYRLQDAAKAIDSGAGGDLAGLAADLGFADQAHFTRSFTEVIGVPPSVYRRAAELGRGDSRAAARRQTAHRGGSSTT